MLEFRKDGKEAFLPSVAPDRGSELETDGETGAGGLARRKVQRLTRAVDSRQLPGMRGVKRRHGDEWPGADDGACLSGEIDEADALEWGSDVKSDLFREDGEWRSTGRGGSVVATGREGRESFVPQESREDSDLASSWDMGHEKNVQRRMQTLRQEPLRLDVLYRCWRALLRLGYARHVEKVRVLTNHTGGVQLLA